MKTANSVSIVGGSSKRQTTFNGLRIGFNQKKTIFYTIEKDLGHDANGGHHYSARILELTDGERDLILATWREGKVEWMAEVFGGRVSGDFTEILGKNGLEIRRIA